MSDPRLRLRAPEAAPLDEGPRRPIGRFLVDRGVLSPRQLVESLHLQRDWDAPLGEILLAEGLASESDVLAAVAQQHGLQGIDLDADPPDPQLFSLLEPELWLRHGVLPWARLGRALILATARPDRLADIKVLLPEEIEGILAVVAPEAQIQRVIAAQCAAPLAHRAETRVAAHYSCRGWQYRRPVFFVWVAIAALALVLLTLASPVLTVQLLSGLALLTLLPVAVLKLAAFGIQLFGRLHDPPEAPPTTPTGPLPRISMLVPLYHETEIAGTLIKRLRRLDYPAALLDVVLVLEEKDTVTRSAIAATDLPQWMRAIEVPENGPLTTKPRALNYALDFCKGDIIGIWDAEDAPVPDQLRTVAAQFAQAPPEVACLQGVLDFYNPRSNWLSRCFAIEYAGWWRVLLPGVARLGLVLPLGGTTLFFRRHALETLGGWDAHNVTEDADLGMRLAREGYRTQLIPTVTHEEANCRLVPWIKQRSRWLKGFMVTWLVHMRHPRRLTRELGWRRIWGFHALMAGTVAQFAFAPVLWSFWLLAFGLPHPAADIAGPGLIVGICGLFVLVELGNLAIGAAGVSGRAHRFLLPWVITMPFYNALGAAAAAKALYELLLRPFFWDKTQHGISAPDVSPAGPDAQRPDADGS